VLRSTVVAAMTAAVSRLGRALADLIRYKEHVRGFTATHPDAPPASRGTYGGLVHGADPEHLVNLSLLQCS